MLRNNHTKQAAIKTINSFKQTFPILIGVLLFVALIITAIPKSFYTKIFTGNTITDPLIGAIFGSIVAGNPLTSYVIGGELLKQGISLIAITAFILAWVTVGVVQFPAEILMLGKRFALVRNLVSFIMAIIIAALVVFTLGLM